MARPPSQQAICALTGFVSLLEMARAKCHEAADNGHQHNGLGIAAAGHVYEQVIAECGLQRRPGVAAGQDQAAAEQTDEQ